MGAVEFALWGLAGGVLVELLELASLTRAHKTFPWQVPGQMRLGAYLYCALTRPAAGAIVAVALGLTNQITGPWGLLVVGAGAPLIIQNATKQAPPAGERIPLSTKAAAADAAVVESIVAEAAVAESVVIEAVAAGDVAGGPVAAEVDQRPVSASPSPSPSPEAASVAATVRRMRGRP